MSKRIQDTPFADLLPESIRQDSGIAAAATALNPALRQLVLGVPNLLLFSRLDTVNSLGVADASGSELIATRRVRQIHSAEHLSAAGAGKDPNDSGQLSPVMQRLANAAGGLKPLSEAELELLAWQFHVDFRDAAGTPEQLAEMVRQSIPWHRIKGTPAAVRLAVGLLFLPPSGTTAGRAAGATQLPRQLQATASVAQDVRPSEIVIEEDGVGQHWATYQLGLPQVADMATVRRVCQVAHEMAPVRCRLWRIYTDNFDRRPIVLANGPKLGEGWLSYYSGVSVPGLPDGDVVVSFGVRNGYQAEMYAVSPLCASFGAQMRLGFLAPYLDTFTVGRSCLSTVLPRNNPFVIGSLFSILWADRARVGRSWSGEWDARSWLDYTGFDRKLPRWRMERRAVSRAQLVPGDGESLSDINARLGVTFAAGVANPPRLGSFRLSAHDCGRKVVRLHEMRLEPHGAETVAVAPAAPHGCMDSFQDFSTATGPLHNEHWAGTWTGQRVWRGYAAHINIISEEAI